ncbi:MAG: hypothetical protein JRG95_25510 [Deltaproteobacteria bacterium]|nr:hypothetical protein [Deltaproteobacteria bacterium]
MPATDTLPDLTPEQLAELDDRMRAARQERHARERAEQGQRQLLRQTRGKLDKIEAEITKLRAERDDKLQTVVMLRERLEGVEELNEHASGVRSERAALVEAIDMAMEKAAPRGTNCHTPIAELGRRLVALTTERDRLQTRLEKLEEVDTENVAA